MKNIIGEIHISSQNQKITIIGSEGSRNCTIQFEDGTVLYNKRYEHIITGKVKNPYFLSVKGVGYIGVGKYTPSTNRKPNKDYGKWSDILERCYDLKLHDRYPTYKDVKICREWHDFQNFAKWYEENYNPDLMKGWHIDKDILIKGNKIYSPETCCFVPPEINALFVKSDKIRGELPIGVSKDRDKFAAQIFIRGNRVHLGSFYSKEEAFQVYKTEKEKHIKDIAEEFLPFIGVKIYQAMINYTVEITD
jgi:hypothetical protein|nr:MAG TPA: hypothetical protein [Caudoviricetes sp.]